MNKNLIIALSLSLFVLVVFQFASSKFYPESAKPLQQEEAPVNIVPSNEPEIPSEVERTFTNEREIVFTNQLYTITFTDIGGGIKNITLNENPKAGLNIPYEIFSAENPNDSLLLFTPDKAGATLNNAKYNVNLYDNQVVFTYNFNNEFALTKRFNISNSLYCIELELVWKNLKPNDLTKEYALVTAVNLTHSRMDDRVLEIVASLDGKLFKNKRSGKPFSIQRNGKLNWAMLKSRYFAIICKPIAESVGYIVNQEKAGKFYASIPVPVFAIPANSNTFQKFSVYAGPSDTKLVKDTNLGIESALSQGILGSIGQILMDVLKFFHRISKNWGVAILLLGLFVNLILFPLTRKSYKSMHEMQVLQPKIQKLQEQHKGNSQKLQKEIMELYKKHKVNPMGGCLPLILQMPIFFALYQGLINFVQLRGSQFLWVRDLSMPENIPLPATLPLIGNSLNILPLLMVVVMFFQQKLSNRLTSASQTEEQKKQQKFMTVIMTVMFGFIFYSMPSGFVLYWLGSTVTMTVIQFMITRNPKTTDIAVA